MRYSIEPRERRFVKGYCFMSFARNFNDKYGNLYGKSLKRLLKLLVRKYLKKSKSNWRFIW